LRQGDGNPLGDGNPPTRIARFRSRRAPRGPICSGSGASLSRAWCFSQRWKNREPAL